MGNKVYNILLVEDDQALGYLLQEYLGMKDFKVQWVKDALKVMEILEVKSFDLVVLDIMMPGLDGFSLGEQIHDAFPGLPFIFLSAKSMKIDVLKGFSLGAVDYLKKPIDEEELVVRIRTLLNRMAPEVKKQDEQQIQLGEYLFNSRNQELLWEQQRIPLTSRENELLRMLVQHQGQLCSHGDILKKLWGRNDYFNRKSLNVFITHLRKHLSKDPRIRIENVHGKGFIFQVSEAD